MISELSNLPPLTGKCSEFDSAYTVFGPKRTAERVVAYFIYFNLQAAKMAAGPIAERNQGKLFILIIRLILVTDALGIC